MVKLIVFRHGETDANKQGICQSVNDDNKFGLNLNGIRQAEDLRDKLSGKNLGLIISSPYQRALKTAEIVASANNINIITHEDLREMHTGNVEGMTYDEFYNEYQTIFGPIEDINHPEFFTTKVPGGESRQEIILRWNNVLDYIKENFQSDETIGIATHYGILKAILFHHHKIDRDEIENCEFFEIEIQN